MEIYYSIQSVGAWELAQQRGYIEGDETRSMFPDAYQWMRQQMQQRLPDDMGNPPIWLWLGKPDMRQTGHDQPGTRIVRLTLQLEPAQVLCSDLEDWHTVLNDSFNANNEEEFDDYYAGRSEVSKEVSWERIFELDQTRDPYWSGEAPRVLQGTTGRIDIKQVIRIEFFTAR